MFVSYISFQLITSRLICQLVCTTTHCRPQWTMLHKLNTIDMKHVVQSCSVNIFPGASNALPYIGVRFNEVQSISTTQSDPLLPPILHIKGPHGTPHAFRVVTSKPLRGNRKPIPPASPTQFFVPPRYWEFASPASHRGHTTWIPVA